MKLTSISKARFREVRDAFLANFQLKWDSQYIDKENFWLDLGFERFAQGTTPTTILRKSSCNLEWARQLRDPYSRVEDSVTITTFPWAGTKAGGITVNTRASNALRWGGLGYCKAYNVLKEQHATQLKGHQPFQDPLYEGLAYTEEHLHQWSSMKLRHQGRWGPKLSRPLILKHLQNTKNRLLAPLQYDNCCFGDRQEWRIKLQLLYALPQTLGVQAQRIHESGAENSHPNCWLLPTAHVNQFRIAEANRWLVTLECIASAAKPLQGTNQTIPLVEQEINSLMATAMARVLRFSLGCLNPKEFPSLWLGKRWVKSRFSNTFQSTICH